MRKTVTAIALVSVSLMLLGCSSGASGDEVRADDSGSTDTTVPSPLPEPEAETAGFSLISSCDDVEGFFGPYIDGLVAAPDNLVGEYGAVCTWTMSEDETDWANAREVSFGVTPVAAGTPAPDVAALSKIGDITALEAEWVTARGGVAYSMALGGGGVGAIVTNVWTPEYEVSIGGGNWENQLSLDAPAALDIARSVLN